MINHRVGRALLVMVAFALESRPATSNHIYIAQNTAGAGDGTSCTDARPATFFNSSTNWGATSTQIGPGTTVHLCGIFSGYANSTMLSTQGAGASGSPITIQFEPGAVLTSPYWGWGGAIAINHQWIVLDGGNTGTIQNTANGTSLQNQQPSRGVVIGASNVTVKNLVIGPIYVFTKGVNDSSTGAESSYGIYNANGSNVTLTGNTLHDMRFANFWICSSGTCDGFIVQNATQYNYDHGVGGGDNGSNVSMTNWIVRNNDFHDMDKWDTPGDYWHHNFVHTWQTYSGSVIRTQIYNNYFHGNWGANVTAGINNEQNVATELYNNIIVNTGSGGAPYGCISAGQGSPLVIANNTCVTTGGMGIYLGGGGNGLTVANNVISGANAALSVAGSYRGTILIDNNDYSGIGGGGWSWPGSPTMTYSSWKTVCACDLHSITSDPGLSATFGLTPASSAVQMGANLGSLNISPLKSDKAGVLRPTGICTSWPAASCWDIGAYQLAVPGPLPPTGLTVQSR